MTALAGYMTSPTFSQHQNPHLSNLSGHDGERDLAWPEHVRPGHKTVHSAVTLRLPVSQQHRRIAGSALAGYSNDFYHRIHIDPVVLELGHVVSAQTSAVRVWNAYLTTQTLSHITGLEEGLKLEGPSSVPFETSPLLETPWQFSVLPTGPATIDAAIKWFFLGVPSPLLKVTGNRIVPWGFAPDWSQPITERMAWHTNILANPNGAEQRRALRLSPRKAWQAHFNVGNEERALMDLALAGWGHKVWAVPVWVDVQVIAAALPAGSNAIACATAGRDFRAGGLALLRGESAFETEAVEILDMHANGITLKRVTQQSWPAGTRIYPVRSARLVAMPQTERLHDRRLRTECEFELAESCDWPAELPSTLYRGGPVFDARPEESTNLEHSYARLTSQLDNLSGLPLVTDTAGKGFVLHQHHWLLQGRAAHSTWRSFMYALRGRSTAVWVPTHADDLTPVAPLVGSVLTVRRVGYSRFGIKQLGRQDIRIELWDGSVLLRRITNAQEVEATEVLTVDSDFASVIQPEAVARISYMALCRNAADEVELEHLSDQDGVARATIIWRGVRDDLEAA